MNPEAVPGVTAGQGAGARRIALVVAMDLNGLIGRGGDLPWRLPEDLKYFKRLTLNHSILMGRKTWHSLGRPLPQRANWVVSRDPQFVAEGASVFRDLQQALAAHREGELMVIGGAEIYRQTLPLADRLYLTQVHARLDGDTWFPPWTPAEFEVLQQEDHAADERHAHAYSFVTLERRW